MFFIIETHTIFYLPGKVYAVARKVCATDRKVCATAG